MTFVIKNSDGSLYRSKRPGKRSYTPTLGLAKQYPTEAVARANIEGRGEKVVPYPGDKLEDRDPGLKKHSAETLRVMNSYVKGGWDAVDRELSDICDEKWNEGKLSERSSQ